jgi:hypothetical protein
VAAVLRRVARPGVRAVRPARRLGRDRSDKRERVKRYVQDQAPQRFRIADVRLALPGISDSTIRNASADLRADTQVDVDGPGRGASWSRRV